MNKFNMSVTYKSKTGETDVYNNEIYSDETNINVRHCGFKVEKYESNGERVEEMVGLYHSPIKLQTGDILDGHEVKTCSESRDVYGNILFYRVRTKP